MVRVIIVEVNTSAFLYYYQRAYKDLPMLYCGSANSGFHEAMTTSTGIHDMDASTIENYFAPLKVWLDEKNKDRRCGW